MNSTITTAESLAFKNTIEPKFQQEGSRLRGRARQETFVGAMLNIDRTLPTTATRVISRNANTEYNDTTFDRRSITRQMATSAGLLDTFDKVRMMADPMNPLVLGATYALGRLIDTDFITQAIGTAYGGQSGATATTFTAGNIIAKDYTDTGGAGNTNLTIDKLRRAREIMDDAEALNPIFMGSQKPSIALPPNALHSLLTYTPVINANYNTVRALVDGNVDTFMGFDFVRLALSFFPSQGAGTGSGILVPVLAWAPQAMCVAVAHDITAKIDQLPTKNYTWQYYCEVIYGVTRLWEEGVVQLLCDSGV